MSSTNQRPTQELSLSSLWGGNTLEGIENFSREIRTTGSSRVLYANSPQDVSLCILVNWTTPTDYPTQRLGPLLGQTDISLEEHIKNARAAIAELLEREQRVEPTGAHQEALAWLARNREKYAGRWIAVRGAELLATGTNAREVYAQVRAMKPSALVLKIEREDLPFAGW